MMITATAEINTRGRVQVSAPARRALDVDGREAQLEIIARTIEPEEFRFSRAHFQQRVTAQGRLTVPKEARLELGVEDIDAILELTMRAID